MSLEGRVENYLLLIDDEFKTSVEGRLLLCVNPNRDCWQPADAVSLETLKKLAVTSVGMRTEREPLFDHKTTPEMKALFKRYGV